MTGRPGTRVIETLVAVLAAKEPRQKPVGDALGIHLRRILIAGSVEHFEGELADGPFEKVDFRLNKDTDVAVLVLKLRAGTPAIVRAEIHASVLSQSDPKLLHYPDIPPEGAVSQIYAAGDREVHLQYGALTRRLIVAAVHWIGAR